MTAQQLSVRERLGHIGVALLTVDTLLFIIGLAHVEHLIRHHAPLQTSLETGAHYFFVGAPLAILTIPLVLFERGWKRLPLVALALILIPLFVNLTLY